MIDIIKTIPVDDINHDCTDIVKGTPITSKILDVNLVIDRRSGGVVPGKR